MPSTLSKLTDRNRAAPATLSGVNETPSPFAQNVVINVRIRNYTDVNTVALEIDSDLLYVRVVENFSGTITWNLDVPKGATAFFDNPGIQFVESSAPKPVRITNTQVVVGWTNSQPGVSFHYRINVVIQIGSVLVPVRHDPTVHNDPPTP
jgi:hypothetical protein